MRANLNTLLKRQRLQAGLTVAEAEAELAATLARLLCGILGHDTETVEYYDGLKNDAINEARAVLAKTEGGVK